MVKCSVTYCKHNHNGMMCVAPEIEINWVRYALDPICYSYIKKEEILNG